MTLRLLTVSFCLLLICVGSSVTRSQEREPGKGNGQFVDAMLTSDGKLGVFTFNRSVPISSEYARSALVFSRAPKELPIGLVIGRTYIGTYSLETGLIKILWMTENRQWLPGSYNIYIDSISGGTALITEQGQRRLTYHVQAIKYYLLDIRSGRLKSLPLPQEVARRRSKLYHVYLVDTDGTMLLETLPTNPPMSVIATTLVDLWVRYPSGEYVLLDKHTHFFRGYSSDGKIYYSSSMGFPAPPHKGMKVYNVRKRTSQEVDYRTVTEKKVAETDLSVNGLGRMIISRKIKGVYPNKWEAEELKINTELLK